MTLSDADSHSSSSEKEPKLLVTDEEFSNIIYSISNCSSAGQDGWNLHLLKAVFAEQPTCVTVLRETFNLMFKRRWFPKCWFVERIVTVPTFSRMNYMKTSTTINLFRRIVATVLLKLYKRELLDLIPPYQFCI
jgi:hypothetical protein